jgi:hypothetical protein
MRLATMLPPGLAAVVGVARSGLVPAGIVAELLHIPLWVMDDSTIYKTGGGWRSPDAKPGPVLVLDDTFFTGRSLNLAKKIAEKELAGTEVLYAVVYRNPIPAAGGELDFWAEDLPGVHLLEWNLFNSVHTPRTAFDIDGILCDESPKSAAWKYGRPPLYPVRKGPLPLVVTGRSERHRASTLAWLERWGMSCQRLEMWQGTDEERERPMAVSRFKAAHYGRSSLALFVESCPIQAREIADITMKPVVCPAAGKVF